MNGPFKKELSFCLAWMGKPIPSHGILKPHERLQCFTN